MPMAKGNTLIAFQVSNQFAEEIDKALDKVSRKEIKTKSDLIRKAIKQFIDNIK